MLDELVTPGPIQPIGDTFEKIYSQLTQRKDFESTLLCGDLATITSPTEYLDFCMLWCRKGNRMPVYCEMFGQSDRLLGSLGNIKPTEPWLNRVETLETMLTQAEEIATSNPYLIGAIGNIRSTNDVPILICWQRRSLPPSIVAAVFHYNPSVHSS